MNIRILFILALIYFVSDLRSQTSAHFYTDFGHSQVSEGLYLKTAIIGDHTFSKFNVEAGIENELISTESKLISAWKIGFGREFEINKLNLYTKAFFMHIPYSGYINETDWGVLGAGEFKRLDFKVGINFKKYYSSGFNIYENANLMYEICYQINDKNQSWNAGICLTNFDDFKIQQATNPMLMLHGKYIFNDKLSWQTELWYITAGAFNLHVNYFGTFLRTGLIWNIK